MSETPKPKPIPRRPDTGPLFMVIRCDSCTWMAAGFGSAAAYTFWEEHANEMEAADPEAICVSFRADVQSQPEWMVPW